MAEPGNRSLRVVIVNYRTPDLVIDCLRSLVGEGAPGFVTRVEVVDNHSGDGSAERIAAAILDQGWGDWASVRPLDTNGGFAAGNNAVIGPALAADDPPRYLLLLNPDTVVRPGALASLVGFMEAHPEVGIAGSRLEDPDGTPQRSAFRFFSVLGEIENGMRLGPVSRLLSRRIVAPPVPSEACPTDWASGACLIVRREVFEAIGLLDEGYFMYFEEADFCLRAARAGWPCWYVPEARVIHLVGQSSGLNVARRRLPAYWFRSRRRYFLVNHGIATTFLADLAWAASYATFQVRRVVQRKSDPVPERMLRDFVRHNFLTPSTGR